MRRRYAATALIFTLLTASVTVLAQAQSRADQRKEMEAKRAEFEKKVATLVASKQDRAKYADFLKAPDTGLIRLLPREKYITEAYSDFKPSAPPVSFTRTTADNLPGGRISLPHPPSSEGGGGLSGGGLPELPDVPRVDSTALKNSRLNNGRGGARDGGAFYSFARRTHDARYGTDLHLERGQFQVSPGGAGYGFLTNLGDMPLESVTLDTPETKILATYTRAKNEPDARVEQRRFREVADLGGVSVNSRLPMQLNSTYLLRAINYRESDVLVAFRVVELDSDGTPLILWKLLKRYSTPQLAVRY